MSELEKAFVAKDVEKKLYAFWEENAFFEATPESEKAPYCIMIPPPNVTGVLHMGHALVNTLQDILIRYKRMCGFDALWLPGTDHAGIATQTVVERHLFKTEGKRRSDYDRETFLNIVSDWKEKSEKNIIAQLKSMGCSCDWKRKRFTMDEGYSKAVRTMFKKLFTDKLIVRDYYLVNWDPVAKTALADDEVEYEEKQSFLWHFRYPLENSTESLEFATTRPETMLGDTAIAVNPKDIRYKEFVGKKVLQPLTNRLLPVIADDHVEAEFGTGVVKITPAHDHNDYRMGISHSLEMINIMTEDGKINENGNEFCGMTMLEARVAVTEAMKKKGFFVKQAPYTTRIGVSYRSKAIIEPYLSKQWFVKLSAFKESLKACVQEGKTKLIPSHWEATYFHWIDNLHDWCISRQLWWGHRIPIWYNKEDPSRILCSDDLEGPEEVQKYPDEWYQDPDVLDTWFSSAMWPFATLGWPENTLELEKYYPNSILVTGHDILFFWVARMLMMGMYAHDEVPFPKTFLHGLIYGKSYWRHDPQHGTTYVGEEERKAYDLGQALPSDVHAKWEKMSKSKGNIIDPLEIIDQYGADACRMALASCATEAPEIDLDLRRFAEYKNFANKVWNGARFILMNVSDLDTKELCQGVDSKLLTLEDHWILQKLGSTVSNVNKNLENCHFDRAASQSYDFYWNELCAYYLETCKPVLFSKLGSRELRKNKQKLLVILLVQACRMLHPMAPFITEELFGHLKAKFGDLQDDFATDTLTKECLTALSAKACIVAPYPQAQTLDISKTAESDFDLLCQIIYAIRNIRGEMKVPQALSVDVDIVGSSSDPSFNMVKNHPHIIQALVKTGQIHFSEKQTEVNKSFAQVGSLKIFVPLPEELKQQEKARLTKEQERVEKQLESLEQKLQNKEFLEKAPQAVVEKLMTSKNQLATELAAIEKQL